MKVAIAWNWPSRLLDCSFRFEQYAAGLRALGHQPVFVCTRDAATGFPGEFHLCETREEMKQPTLWREVGAEAVLIVTWHRMAEELRAIKEAGSRAVAISDSDGRAGAKIFWRWNLERQILYQKARAAKLRFFINWLVLQARQRFWRSFPEDQLSVDSTRESDVVALGHQKGVANFRRFLESMGAGELGEKLRVVPFTIGASFLSCPLPEQKENRIVAIGRWDDPQKNAQLMAATLRLFFEKNPGTRVDIFGQGGEPFFGEMQKEFPGLAYRGTQQQEVVAETLSRARSILFSSRWEGCPHAAIEMLALGGTLVGTRMPSLESWIEEGRYGRVAAPRAGELAKAIEDEMRTWESGERDAHAIARTWRERVRPEAVCAALLAE
jgi:glycosyltransferase involved in cell wall biosynthesis